MTPADRNETSSAINPEATEEMAKYGQALAPTCPHCGCRIIGHGVEHNGTIFCCVHCAKKEGVKDLRDRD